MSDVSLLRSFGVLNRTFLTYFSAALEDEGLSYSEGIILANLGQRPGATQSALAAELVIDRAAVARSVKGLGTKGLVRVVQAATDRRVKNLHLTPAGERMVREIDRWNDVWVGFVTDGLDDAQRETVIAALDMFAARAKHATGDELRKWAATQSG